MAKKLPLRILGLGYLALLLVLPLTLVFYRTFEDGFDAIVRTIESPEATHAFWMTLLMVVIAVPLNTVFGVICALTLTRTKSRLKGILNLLIDLPFAISPVVAGLALILVYGQKETVGGWFADQGIQIIFSWPGMAIATVFVSLPFVVREVIPILREVGTEQEQAASTLGASSWQTFWKITLPSIRWGVAYGVVLTAARALGEYGAVAVVSGRITGSTQTMTLYVEERFHQFDLTGAYVASMLLAIVALIILIVMHKLKPEGAAENL